MPKAMHSLSCNETIIFAAIDNNQKGHGLTFQKFGSSNKSAKVTA